MENKQTAVEWLVEEMFKQGYLNDKPLTIKNIERFVEQAKEMEKKQHGNTWDTALDKYEVRAGNYMRAYEDFDEYYKETFKSE
jgi:hypothetical protein